MPSTFRIAFPFYLLPSHPPSLILVPAPSSPLHFSSRFVTTSRLPFALSRLAVSTILHLSFLSSMDRTSSTPLPNVVLSPPLSSTPLSYHLTPSSSLGEPISLPYPLHYSSQSSLTSLPSTYYIISVTKLLLSFLSSPSTPLHTTLLSFLLSSISFLSYSSCSLPLSPLILSNIFLGHLIFSSFSHLSSFSFHLLNLSSLLPRFPISPPLDPQHSAPCLSPSPASSPQPSSSPLPELRRVSLLLPSALSIVLPPPSQMTTSFLLLRLHPHPSNCPPLIQCLRRWVGL